MKRTAAIALVALWMMGCGGAPRGTGVTIAPQLAMTFDSGDGQYIRYDVKPDGTLRFAGGQDVINDTWSWTGSISAAQGAELTRIIDQAGWVARAPKGGGGNDPVWHVSVRTAGGSRSFEMHGDAPSVSKAFDVLKQAGMARLNRDLQRAPRPDLEVMTQRRNAEAAATPSTP